MSSFHDNGIFKWQVGLETDIGGGRENQDDCFVWIKRDDNIIVLCVLDGHGREVGKIASESAKSCLFKHLDDNYLQLIENPVQFLVAAHELAHSHIRSCFQAELERQGFEVVVTAEGYLMKRRQQGDCWACVHGGTSCSIAALISGDLYVANVGDSTGILCSSHGVLSGADLKYLHDAAVPPELARDHLSLGLGLGVSAGVVGSPNTGYTTSGSVATAGAVGGSNSNGSNTSSETNADDGIGKTAVTTELATVSAVSAMAVPASVGVISPGSPSAASSSSSVTSTPTAAVRSISISNTTTHTNTLVITAEHSPECPYEYSRLHRFRAREGHPALPALVVVYDSSSSDKTRCAAVFERDSTGLPCVTNKGR